MLFKETVEKDTLSILDALQKDENLSNFYLVGGTALALNLGHRKSIDLDMFSPKPFDTEQLLKYLSEKHEFVRLFPFTKLSKVILQGKIKDVKVDWVVHPYPFIEHTATTEGIRMYGLKDIAAMKLIAIADTGTRLKDFVDVAYMSAIMSLNEMLDAFEKKYNAEKERAWLGLTYFSDIDFKAKIDLIDAAYRFEPINERLHDMKRYPNKVFPDFPIMKNH